MLSRHLAGRLTAAAVAGVMALTALPTTAASAASVQFFFGPYERHSMFYDGRNAVKVCHTRYKWVWHHHKRRAVAIGTECHWEYPARPMFQFGFGFGNNDHHWDHHPKP